MNDFKEYKGLDLTSVAAEVLTKWDKEHTFESSLELRKEGKPFVFYEGPPSANGMPGIHHMMARTIKDVFCRYKTQQGFLVRRKAGWDTHGLPVELGVEKKLGITKDDIGVTISIEDYNRACREAVMEFTGVWEDMTRRMGYWVDMSDPYITYETRYMETLWWMLKQLYEKGLLYKGYTIQPYSPAAGTGLSNHELNQPGCYRDVKDTTITAQFKVIFDDAVCRQSGADFAPSEGASEGIVRRGTAPSENQEGAKSAPLSRQTYLLAWTTTPWTLPSNTALAVNPTIDYVEVECANPYSGEPQTVILAKALVEKYFNKVEYKILRECKGADLIGMRYEQLLPWVRPNGDAFRVIAGDYVTTEDGTGIVHIAPTFGADDARVAAAAGIPGLFVTDKSGKQQPLVDRKGRFWELGDISSDNIDVDQYTPWAGRFVKAEYDPEERESLDVELAVYLKSQNKAFKIEKYTHNYPHCWRTDKPVLYYPLDSWFIRTTAVKDRLIELNETIKWRPESTGSGRFGKWLEGLVDWNLSRSRFWGTPLPIWATEDYSEIKCIGSVAELIEEIDKSISKGFMANNPYKGKSLSEIDLHRPYVDNVILVSDKGMPMHRETDLIDVWFDSGAMPYAQSHFPFEVSEDDFFGKLFPADFIAEGVDQTRGWFFTLHALATMLFDSVAFKNIISNGLVLDKNGNKMSKRLGNGVDPFEMMDKYGVDAVRWYMISNSQPWDNLKFDAEGVDEVRRKFFGTLYNTYSFFALYANVDGFSCDAPLVPVSERPEIDRWVISLLNSLVSEVTARLEDYDPTPAARAIAEFVGENLSNWYVRLNRKRFWGGGMDKDKLAAYQTLYTCLETVAKLIAPFAPFYAERLWGDLAGGDSVHLTTFPTSDNTLIDSELEQTMALAQQVSSMVLALRRKVNIKVRQPLSRIVLPVLDDIIANRLTSVQGLILGEVNVKELELIRDTTGLITKQIKPNFKTLGKKFGAQMKTIAALVAGFSQEQITKIERSDVTTLVVDGEPLMMERADFEITSEDMPGWLVATEGAVTVALDITLTEELRREGMARELVNRIQNLRKDSGLEVTDKIEVVIESLPVVEDSLVTEREYVAGQVLAVSISTDAEPHGQFIEQFDIDETAVKIAINLVGK